VLEGGHEVVRGRAGDREGARAGTEEFRHTIGVVQPERNVGRFGEDSEFEEEGHIPGARHLYVGYIDEHLDRIKVDLQKKPHLVVTCSVGHRAGVAVSLLERRGIRNAKNLLGGMTAWQRLDLPTKKDREHTITTPDIEGVRR
jgi:hydroxyacylglutathione hydrolase